MKRYPSAALFFLTASAMGILVGMGIAHANEAPSKFVYRYKSPIAFSVPAAPGETDPGEDPGEPEGPEEPDNVPEPFSFQALTGVIDYSPLHYEHVQSSTAVLSGFDGLLQASLAAPGGRDATLLVNGSAVGTAAMVSPGDTIAISARAPSFNPPDPSRVVDHYTVAIGGTAGTWFVETRDPFLNPDAGFSFTSASNNPGTVRNFASKVGGFDWGYLQPVEVSCNGTVATATFSISTQEEGGTPVYGSPLAIPGAYSINSGNRIRFTITAPASGQVKTCMVTVGQGAGAVTRAVSLTGL